jgi:NTE family protein
VSQPPTPLVHDGAVFASLSPANQAQLRSTATPVTVPAGEWLMRQGDSGDALYVVEAGRLEVIVEDPPPPHRINILRQGDTLGELAVLTGHPRVASVLAVRDTRVLRLGREAFFALSQQDPSFTVMVATALARLVEQGTRVRSVLSRANGVIALVPLQPDLPMGRIVEELTRVLRRWGRVALLDREGPGASNEASASALGRRLDRDEQDHKHILMVVPAAVDDAWRQFSLRQADRVVACTWADARPAPFWRGLQGCDLVLVDRGATTPPVDRTLDALAPTARHRLATDHRFGPEVARLARRLVGRSVGVVLSGGGARGLAHLGALQALEEAGVVVDRIGGCSMGAFVGALYASGLSVADALAICRAELVDRRPFNDYTIPRVALIRARKAEAMLRRTFGSTRIEELRRDYFCVSAEMVSAEVVVHRRGPLPEAVGASMSIPGLVPPVAHDGRLLIDGGVLNNLPIDVMVASDEGPVIAVDVMSRRLLGGAQAHAGAVRSGRLSWRPGSGHAARNRTLPTIVETLSRATVLGSWRTAAENRRRADLVITPELEGLGLFEFERIDATVEAGRRATEAALEQAPSSIEAVGDAPGAAKD